MDKIHQVVETHPEILPAVFDKEEFMKDYELFNKLRPVYNLMNELAEGLQKTFTAVGSDTLVAHSMCMHLSNKTRTKFPV